MSETLQPQRIEADQNVQRADLTEFLNEQLAYEPVSVEDAQNQVDLFTGVTTDVAAKQNTEMYSIDAKSKDTKQALSEAKKIAAEGIAHWSLSNKKREAYEKVVTTTFVGDVPKNLKEEMASLTKDGEPEFIGLKRLKEESARKLLLDREISEKIADNKMQAEKQRVADLAFDKVKAEKLAEIDGAVVNALDNPNLTDASKEMLETNMRTSLANKAELAATAAADAAAAEREAYITANGGVEAIDKIVKREAREAAAAEKLAAEQAKEAEKQAFLDGIAERNKPAIIDNRDEANKPVQPEDMSNGEWLRMGHRERRAASDNWKQRQELRVDDIAEAQDEADFINGVVDLFDHSYASDIAKLSESELSKLLITDTLPDGTKLHRRAVASAQPAVPAARPAATSPADTNPTVVIPVAGVVANPANTVTPAPAVQQKRTWLDRFKYNRNGEERSKTSRVTALIGTVALVGAGITAAFLSMKSGTYDGTVPDVSSMLDQAGNYKVETGTFSSAAAPNLAEMVTVDTSNVPDTSLAEMLTVNTSAAPEVIAAAPTAELSLGQGDTVWGQVSSFLEANGYPTDDVTIDTVKDAILQQQGLSEQAASQLPVGYNFTIPQEILEQLNKVS